MRGMTLIVKTISSWLKPLICLFGVYVIIFGDFTPGGGFAGGVVLASSYVLLMLAFGREFAEKNLPLFVALRLACVGALAFAAIAIFPLLHDSAGFFSNFLYDGHLSAEDLELGLMGSGTIFLAELAIGLTVGAAVFLVIVSLFVCREGRPCRFD
ncbi:MAG: hypothetical protein AMJ75_10710 [Phycisphaerae bacterium SM1_79]|nr:MAG: hypothetical protein AMJ75_10710 [Phycisphaerae bacterium SM1_79]